MSINDTNIESHNSFQTLITLKEFAVVQDSNGQLNVYTSKSVEDKSFDSYLIEGNTIDNVYLPKNHELIILHTSNNIIAIDYDNNVLKDEKWTDYFIEPYSQQLFRKIHNHWYDIEGHMLNPPIFILEDTLICLPTKSSKRSISFKEQSLKTNPDYSLIQIGKLVFNADLHLLNYQGEKITSIRNKRIRLKDTIIQEIGIGKYNTGFISLDTLQPFLLKGELITEHIYSKTINETTYELFLSEENRFVINAKTNEAITIDDIPVHLDLEDYILFNEYQLVNGKLENRDIVYNLKTQSLFELEAVTPHDISKIQTSVININEDKIINLNAGQHEYVFNMIKHKLFTLNDGQLTPQKIETLDSYSEYFGKAIIDGNDRIFYLDTCCVLHFDDGAVYIQSILDVEKNKLINALDSHNELIVLDARNGYNNLELAKVESQQIQQVEDSPQTLGIARVQNATLNSTGGPINRTVRIDTPDIRLFTLDNSLESFPDGEQVSVFAGNPIINIDFNLLITFGDDTFLTFKFIPYHEVPTQGYINQSSGKVLFVEGEANRHEIVTGIPKNPIVYHLGEHRLIQVNTLTEDFKERQIMMCQQTKKTWLKFHDDHLPALEHHTVSDTDSTWNYQLFKVRSSDKESRYLVAERDAPYRILVEETSGQIKPKLIKSNDQVLKEPKKRSRFAKLFLNDPGFLK